MMRRSKINILLCDTFPGLLPPEIPSYASMFREMFRAVDGSLEFEVFPVMAGILPKELEKDELYLITGSNSSAYDDDPWILELIQWIRDVASLHIKLIGICFGHQVIAQALGARSSGMPEVGVLVFVNLSSQTKSCINISQMVDCASCIIIMTK